MTFTRPSKYRLPIEITLKPIKNPMQKPFWSLTIDGDHISCTTKKAAFDRITNRYRNVFKTDEQVYRELTADHYEFFQCPFNYNYRAEKGFYQNFRDKCDTVDADIVAWVGWYRTQRKVA